MMSEPVGSIGKEIATDVHRGIGMTGTPVLLKVKKAAGAESNFDVAKDVCANVKSNLVENMEPHNVDVGEPPVDVVLLNEKHDAATTDFLCSGSMAKPPKLAAKSVLKIAAHALRNFEISVRDPTPSARNGHKAKKT